VLLADPTLSVSTASPRLEVHFATGIVRARGVEVMLTSTEHALLFSIARHRHPSTREELIDLVWGEAPPCQAQNAFNVALHRLRRRLGGPDAIVHSMLGYALCDQALVDLADLEALGRASKRISALTDVELAALQRAYEAWRTSAGRIAERHQWLEATSYRARTLVAELGIAFGRHVLQRGDTATALEIAQDLIDADACDEQATELALLALLQRGDRGAALRVYRRYSEQLGRELGLRPSRHLETLFDQPVAV
jgi:DNA-binding SARP family transcriptional activator